jgi:hypothetical protein
LRRTRRQNFADTAELLFKLLMHYNISSVNWKQGHDGPKKGLLSVRRSRTESRGLGDDVKGMERLGVGFDAEDLEMMSL